MEDAGKAGVEWWVVEASVVQPARQAAAGAGLWLILRNGKIRPHPAVHTKQTILRTLPLNSCLRLPRAVGPELGALLLYI